MGWYDAEGYYFLIYFLDKLLHIPRHALYNFSRTWSGLKRAARLISQRKKAAISRNSATHILSRSYISSPRNLCREKRHAIRISHARVY